MFGENVSSTLSPADFSGCLPIVRFSMRPTLATLFKVGCAHFIPRVFYNLLCFFVSPYNWSLSNTAWCLLVTYIVCKICSLLEYSLLEESVCLVQWHVWVSRYSVWHMEGIKEISGECIKELRSPISLSIWHFKFILCTHSV